MNLQRSISRTLDERFELKNGFKIQVAENPPSTENLIYYNPGEMDSQGKSEDEEKLKKIFERSGSLGKIQIGEERQSLKQLDIEHKWISVDKKFKRAPSSGESLQIGYGLAISQSNMGIDPQNEINIELQVVGFENNRISNETSMLRGSYTILARMQEGKGIFDMIELMEEIAAEFLHAPNCPIEIPEEFIPDPIIKNIEGEKKKISIARSTSGINSPNIQLTTVSSGPGFPVDAWYVYPVQFGFESIMTLITEPVAA